MNKHHFSIIIIIFSLLYLPQTSELNESHQRRVQDSISKEIIQNTNRISQSRTQTQIKSINNQLISDNYYSVFLLNQGQLAENFSLYAILPQGIVYFNTSSIIYKIAGSTFHINFIGSNLVEPVGIDNLNSYSNYFIGKQYFINTTQYSSILYKNIYNGISLRYYFTNEGIKYEFIVDSFIDINLIKMRYSGYENYKVTLTSIELTSFNVTFIDAKLSVWYDDTGEIIKSHYNFEPCIIMKCLDIQFEIPSYDHTRTIVIDPLVISFSSVFGGMLNEISFDIIIDDNEYIYITGWTQSADFYNLNSYQANFGGSNFTGDAFITKLSKNGSTIIYSTFIGGVGKDEGIDLAIDSDNNVYLTGLTGSVDFPTSKNAFDSTYNGGQTAGDIFISKFSADGTELIYSTFIGGFDDDWSFSIAIDHDKNVYIGGATLSINYPTTLNSFDSNFNGPFNTGGFVPGDIIISKLSANGSVLLDSTYIGGLGIEFVNSITIDDQLNIYFIGSTNSDTDFPVVNAIDSTYNGKGDVFVGKLSSDFSNLIFLTYIGGNESETGSAISLDSENNPIIIGFTSSTNFPTTKNAFSKTINGLGDSFIFKISSDGSDIIYSTFFGGESVDEGLDVVLDNNDYIYLLGVTISENFPLKNSENYSNRGKKDIFVSKFTPNGQSLVFSILLGGSEDDDPTAITIDKENNVYITGYTQSTDIPVIGFETFNRGESNIFVIKISQTSPSPANFFSDFVLTSGISVFIVSILLAYYPKFKKWT